jgi:hypothetical protein
MKATPPTRPVKPGSYRWHCFAARRIAVISMIVFIFDFDDSLFGLSQNEFVFDSLRKKKARGIAK